MLSFAAIRVERGKASNARSLQEENWTPPGGTAKDSAPAPGDVKGSKGHGIPDMPHSHVLDALVGLSL